MGDLQDVVTDNAASMALTAANQAEAHTEIEIITAVGEEDVNVVVEHRQKLGQVEAHVVKAQKDLELTRRGRRHGRRFRPVRGGEGRREADGRDWR